MKEKYEKVRKKEENLGSEKEEGKEGKNEIDMKYK